jgi:hypothetical protein
MPITKIEYEQRRHVFDFCTWINEKMLELEDQPNFDEIYFERKDPFVKKLVEEAVPISYFGLYLVKTRKDIFVTCKSDNQSYDGLIEIGGFHRAEEIKVEVCVTEDEESTMRRQALSRNGIVYFTGNMQRNKREIITEPEMVDIEDESKRIIDLAFARFESKVNRGYDSQTAILVYITAYRPLGHRHRVKLLERAKQYLRVNQPPIYGFYFCYSTDLGIDGLRNNLSELRL